MDSQAPAGPPLEANHLPHSYSSDTPQHRTSVPSIRSLLGPNLSLPSFPSSNPLSRSTSPPAPRSSQDFVDLTNDSDSPDLCTQDSSAPSSHRRTNGEPARKRRRVSEHEAAPNASSSQLQPIDLEAFDALNDFSEVDFPPFDIDDEEIEEVDLSNVQSDLDLKKHQSEQRRRHMEMQEQQNQLLKESVTAQQEDSSGPASLSKLSCVICMENMTDITATHCGHLFCHTCIMEALIAGEQQGHEPGKGLSRCPVCRKKVTRSQGKSKDPQQVIPLEIKFIRRSEKSKGKQREAVWEA